MHRTNYRRCITDNNNYISDCINSITYIGIYIIICSIIIKAINYSAIPSFYKVLFTIPIEITNSCKEIICINSLPIDTKIALIFSNVSFGGICSIFQTKKVIEKTGLSIISYILYKLFIAIISYYATILII